MKPDRRIMGILGAGWMLTAATIGLVSLARVPAEAPRAAGSTPFRTLPPTFALPRQHVSVAFFSAGHVPRDMPLPSHQAPLDPFGAGAPHRSLDLIDSRIHPTVDVEGLP